MNNGPPSSPSSQRVPASQPAPSSAPSSSQHLSMTPFVLARLSKALGPTRGMEVMDAALGRMGLRVLDTPQELLDFSEHLIRQGGLVQAVGRSLKVQAFLRGAVEAA